MLRKPTSPRSFLSGHARTMHLLALTTTITAVTFWIVAGFLKAGGAAGVSDLVSLGAYALTALTVVVGPLSLIASNPA